MQKGKDAQFLAQAVIAATAMLWVGVGLGCSSGCFSKDFMPLGCKVVVVGGGYGGAIGKGKVKLRVQLIEQVGLTDALHARNEPQIICFLGFTANSPRRASSLEN